MFLSLGKLEPRLRERAGVGEAASRHFSGSHHQGQVVRTCCSFGVSNTLSLQMGHRPEMLWLQGEGRTGLGGRRGPSSHHPPCGGFFTHTGSKFRGTKPVTPRMFAALQTLS